MPLRQHGASAWTQPAPIDGVTDDVAWTVAWYKITERSSVSGIGDHWNGYIGRGRFPRTDINQHAWGQGCTG